MLNYLLEVTVCWGVFYLIYALLLSRQTFFAANRWYLLATLALGLVIPLLEWQPSVTVEQHPIVTTVEPIQVTVQQFEQIIVVAQEQNHFNWWNVLLALYWLGVVVFTLRFGHGLWKIWQVYRSSEVIQNGKYRIVYTDTEHLPYSFFNCLFWSKKHDASLAAQQQILRHEEAHINGWHTLDVLWMEILSILFWCSPMIYLYRASMRNVHEYLADAWVLQTTNKRTYGHLLLSQSLSGFQIALANNFINSQLKKRIIMMTRHESPRQAVMRYLWLLPIVVLATLIFSKKENRAILQARLSAATEPYAALYERLEQSHNLDTWHYLAAEYGELAAKHPDKEHEIAIMCNQLAQKQGFIFLTNEFKDGSFLMLINEASANVDRLPRFMDCKRFGSSNLAKDICAESVMHEFIYRHLNYPEATKKYAYEGEIYLRMRIEADGSVSKISTEHLRDVDTNCEKEALRIAGKMVNWLPAERNEQAVACDLIVPFIFSPSGVPALYAPSLAKETIVREQILDTLKATFQLVNEEIKHIRIKKNSERGLSNEAFKAYIAEHLEKGEHRASFDMSVKMVYSIPDQSVVAYETGHIFPMFGIDPHFPACKHIEADEERFECANERLTEFVADNIRYPEAARKAGFQGSPTVQFMVEADGSLTEFRMVKNPNDGIFEEEVIRLMKLMPKWVPGWHNGNAIERRMTLSISFALDEKNKAKTSTTTTNGVKTLRKLMPEFPSCRGCKVVSLKTEGMTGYDFSEVVYKEPDYRKNRKAVQGYGIVDFIVAPTGELSKIIVMQRVNETFDKAMIDAVRHIPKWTAESRAKEPIRMRCHVPVFEDVENVHFEKSPSNDELWVEDLKVDLDEKTGKLRLAFRAVAAPLSIRIAKNYGTEVYDRKLNDFSGTFDDIVYYEANKDNDYFLFLQQGDRTFTRRLAAGKVDAVQQVKLQSNDSIPFLAGKGWPFEIVPLRCKAEDFKQSSDFSMRMHPVHKTQKMHKGIDFVANLGTPVIASTDGFVKEINRHKGGYGNHVILDHGRDFKTLYAHMSKIVAKQDDYVRKGEVIGYIGSSGASSSPHLHYEVIHKEKKIDPYLIPTKEFLRIPYGLGINEPQYSEGDLLKFWEHLNYLEQNYSKVPHLEKEHKTLLEEFGFKNDTDLEEKLKTMQFAEKDKLFKQLKKKTLKVKNLVISPNPSDGNFKIKGKIKPGAVNIEVYTKEGKVIANKHIKASENLTGDLDIDMSILRLTVGNTFFVRIWQNEQLYIEQILIKQY